MAGHIWPNFTGLSVTKFSPAEADTSSWSRGCLLKSELTVLASLFGHPSQVCFDLPLCLARVL